MGRNRNKVAISSSNDNFGRALRVVLELEDIEVVGGAANVEGELDLLIWRVDGQDLPAYLRDNTTNQPTLVLASEQLLMEAVDAGCKGFLTTEAPLDEVAEAAHTVLAGGSVIPPDLLGTVLQHLVRRRRNVLDLDSLTPREKDVFELAAQGLRKEDIGERLYISPATARTHLQRVYKKLGVHSQAELVSLTRGEQPQEAGANDD